MHLIIPALHLPLYFARHADHFRSDEGGGTFIKKMKKCSRKGKPSEKMGCKATDPIEQNSRKAELPGGPLRYRVNTRCEWRQHLC